MGDSTMESTEESEKHSLINGVLLLYNCRVYDLAPSLNEFVDALGASENYSVWPVNTEHGFPKGLSDAQFKVIVLHYSIFCHDHYPLSQGFLEYLKASKGYKVAMFQDEHCNCMQRFSFIKDNRINCIYTLLQESEYGKVYGKYTPEVGRIITYLPGYVSDVLINASKDVTWDSVKKSLDITYRARELPLSWGRKGKEKTEIAHQFLKHSSQYQLVTDICVGEESRKGGLDWYDFLASSKGCLGVEAGVSIFDLEDSVSEKTKAYLSSAKSLSYEEFWRTVLEPHEDLVYYRTISPRHFEAIAFRVCQVLFEGTYSGVLTPWEHYIPLKKDFSNINQVIEAFLDGETRKRITDTAYEDIILSGKYDLKSFVEDFERQIFMGRVDCKSNSSIDHSVEKLMRKGKLGRDLRERSLKFVFNVFPGKRFLFKYVKPLWFHYKNIQKKGKS